MTNKQFSTTNSEFIEACKAVGLPKHVVVVHSHNKTEKKETTEMGLARQASKYRNKKGLAYKTKYNLL